MELPDWQISSSTAIKFAGCHQTDEETEASKKVGDWLFVAAVFRRAKSLET